MIPHAIIKFYPMNKVTCQNTEFENRTYQGENSIKRFFKRGA